MKSLVVTYNSEKRIDRAFDKALGEFMLEHGMKMWASGFDLTNGERDIAYKPIEASSQSANLSEGNQ